MATLPVILLGCHRVTAHVEEGVHTPAANFSVFDGIEYRHKPPSADLGMIPINGTGSFWANDADRSEVDSQQIRKVIRQIAGTAAMLYVDIENWDVCHVSDSVTARSMLKLGRVLDLARSAAPSAKFGLYSILPQRDYWSVVNGDSAALRAWRSCNARLTPLSHKVDVVFPSLYTFYDDSIGWEKYARANLREARRYGKPVIAFLWPEFHDSNATLRGKFLSGAFWRKELELCRAEADGIVVWSAGHAEWNESAEWWTETKEFLAGLQSEAPRRDLPLR